MFLHESLLCESTKDTQYVYLKYNVRQYGQKI